MNKRRVGQMRHFQDMFQTPTYIGRVVVLEVSFSQIFHVLPLKESNTENLVETFPEVETTSCVHGDTKTSHPLLKKLVLIEKLNGKNLFKKYYLCNSIVCCTLEDFFSLNILLRIILCVTLETFFPLHSQYS